MPKVNTGSAVNNLLFPVKLGLYVLSMLGGLGSTALLTSCGYRALYATAPAERWAVVPGEQRVPEQLAVEGVLQGVSTELSAAGALKSSGYPRAIVEVVRVDEQTAGISSASARPKNVPLARGSSIGVAARAWIQSAPGAPAARDSGDMRRVEQYANDSVPTEEAATREDAIRAAARQVGQALARRLLGLPEAANEPL
jgi:hypothetical protein